MAEIIVKQYHNPELQLQEIDRCLKRLKKDLEREQTLTILKERQYYRKPSEIKREKEKMVKSLMERKRQKREAWEERYGDMKFVKRPNPNPNNPNPISGRIIPEPD
jgi:ribosomal protein S21